MSWDAMVFAGLGACLLGVAVDRLSVCGKQLRRIADMLENGVKVEAPPVAGDEWKNAANDSE